MIEEVPAGLELRPGLDQRVPYRLVGADGLAERLSFLRVAPGVVHRGRGDAVRDRGDLELLDVERWFQPSGPPRTSSIGTPTSSKITSLVAA